MDCVIETESLLKVYGDLAAVKGVSVKVRKGDIYGVIGKNGAGKTSLLKLILGLTFPTSGGIKLFGSEDLSAERKRIGSLIEEPALYNGVSAFENMKRFSYLSPTDDEEINRLLEFVGLANVGKKPVKAFSLGMKQRLGIAIALLGKPEVLILDEPMNGLDPAGIKEIRDLILKLNAEGVTFVISSHILDELEKVATKYGIVSGGEIEEITAEELEEKCRGGLRVSVDDVEKAKKIIAEQFKDLSVSAGDGFIVISGAAESAEIGKALFAAGVNVYEIKVEHTEFEDYFIERLGKTI